MLEFHMFVLFLAFLPIVAFWLLGSACVFRGRPVPCGILISPSITQQLPYQMAEQCS